MEDGFQSCQSASTSSSSGAVARSGSIAMLTAKRPPDFELGGIVEREASGAGIREQLPVLKHNFVPAPQDGMPAEIRVIAPREVAAEVRAAAFRARQSRAQN